MEYDEIIDWLLNGDVSVQYQVHRDLLNSHQPLLRDRIETEGWGAGFLSRRQPNGHWRRAFYQPKWISTHYTFLDLKNLHISPHVAPIRETLAMIFDNEKGEDGGIKPIGPTQVCDVCVNGMALNYSSYFRVREKDLKSVVDFILSQHMSDGGFNCLSNRIGVQHSSLHSTISVAEGILEYASNGYHYRLDELRGAEKGCQEFMLQHRLFKSDRTGAIIDDRMLMLSYPCRWKYDILRALDYFQTAYIAYDSRMDDALDILLKKRHRDGRWPRQAKHPGQVHFDMENSREPSRWNTLRAMRALKQFAPSTLFGQN